MQTNVVITVFDIESEAFRAFNELCSATYGDDYEVFEAGLIRKKNNTIELLDGFTFAPVDSGVSKGIIIGSLLGVIGGPIGVLLGAYTGGAAGAVSDAEWALDSASVVAVVASKIYAGETAIVALVEEEEPAFDRVFSEYPCTIIRYDAVDISEDVDRLYDLEAEISNQVVEKLRAERKAEKQALREERRAADRASLEATLATRDKTISETNKIVMNLRPI